MAFEFSASHLTSFPGLLNTALRICPDYVNIRETLEEIGSRPIRLTAHPGPFNQLGWSGECIDEYNKRSGNAIGGFDLMGLQPSHWNKINFHVGGTYGDKAATLTRFAKNFGLLSENLRARLTVENDDRVSLYTVSDLVLLHESIGIPIVFDYFHHALNPGMQTEEEAFYDGV